MNKSVLLPQAIKEDRPRLSPAAREELKALSKRRTGRFLMEAIYAWVLIFTAIWIAVQAGNIWVSLLVMFFIASRQNILTLLIHDQVHCSSMKAWPGDLITNLLCGYPMLLLTVEGYAQVHLSHHKHYFTDQDPDYLRKQGEDWRIPIPPRRLAVLFLSDLLMINVWKLVKGKKMEVITVFKRTRPTPKSVRLVYFTVVAGLLTWTGTWDLFLLYWILPLFTFFQLWVRWGALCEHEYNHQGANVAETSPIIKNTWWEKVLLPNLNFTLHPYHHYYPGIGFYNLPKVHALFVRDGLVDESRIFNGYWSYLKFVTGIENTCLEKAKA